MSTPTPYFFLSYSREDAALQRRFIAELHGRGINDWADTENLIPGPPAWEREIERSNKEIGLPRVGLPISRARCGSGKCGLSTLMASG